MGQASGGSTEKLKKFYDNRDVAPLSPRTVQMGVYTYSQDTVKDNENGVRPRTV